MPIPGPRNQFGPDPGYRNPDGAKPDLFNHWKRPGPVWWPGRTPGRMFTNLRGNVLAPGQIRHMWKQAVNFTPAQAGFSWTESAPGAGGRITSPGGFHLTRALRYLTRSVYVAGGTDHTRFDAMHTVIVKKNAYKTVTVNAGQVRNRPTVRNRMSSFGSRVPTLNQQVSAAESSQQ